MEKNERKRKSKVKKPYVNPYLKRILENTKWVPKPFPPVDNEFCESHIGLTPNGGDYSTAYFYDKDGNPCRRE